MRIAIDIDGTVSRIPSRFKQFVDDLRKQGNKVGFLTGSSEKDQLEEFRVKQLKNLGFEEDDYDFLKVAFGNNSTEVAKEKGKFCVDREIDILFENEELYIKEVKSISPNTTCWYIGEELL